MSAKIIMIDMDGVLTSDTAWTIEDARKCKPNQKAIDKIWKTFRNDFIIIYTARKDKLIPETLKWLRRHNIYYNAISNEKQPAHLYIDDRCINITDFMKGGGKCHAENVMKKTAYAGTITKTTKKSQTKSSLKIK